MENKEEILDWLYNLSVHGIKLGLRNTTVLLERLGNPQDSFRKIHVAGTDGKGSTCAMIASILREAGIRTGLYTSPHIIDFNERISVSGQQITDAELEHYAGIIRPIVEDMRKEGMQCTFFEATTAMAFAYFRDKGVEYAVVEVGMGGRFDATNIIVPDVSVITTISMEHTEYLGDTIEKIAFEKAGIIKEGVPVVTVNTGAPLSVIEDVAASRGSRVMRTEPAEVVSLSENGTLMRYRGKEYTVGIPGSYQAMNASMAIEAIGCLPCRERLEQFIESGLRKVRWPCRMEKIEGMPLILDASHTKVGSKAMADDIGTIYGKVTVVFGVLSDKDIDGVAENISRIASKVIVTVPVSERAADVERTAEAVRRYVKDVTVLPDINEAFGRAMELRNGENVLVTGSFIMAEDALKWLKRTSAGF